MGEAFANQIEVESPEHGGVRVDHPRLMEYIKSGLKQGWSNEHICHVVGCVPEMITKARAQMEKEKHKKV